MALPIVLLIATTPRIAMLDSFSCTSLQQQIKQPDLVVIVGDQRSLNFRERQQLQTKIPDIELVFLRNTGLAGVAASWNEGFDYISSRYPDCYVAILDDDDIWHKQHLHNCIAFGNESAADVVLSGIKIRKHGDVIHENIPNDIGNPGWQGSNTFVRLGKVLEVGGFRSGLISCNDRDFAIRMLDAEPKIAYTGCSTVTWNFDMSSDALSCVGSPQKLKGAAQFYQIYQHRMNSEQQAQYFSRMEKLFKLDKQQILDQGNEEKFNDVRNTSSTKG